MAERGGTNQNIQKALENGCRGTPRAVKSRPRGLHKAQVHARALLKDIRKAHRAKKYKKADAITALYLKSNDAKYAAVWVACQSLKEHQRPNAGRLFGIAKSLDPWARTQEPVHLWFKQKDAKTHKVRPIMDFGIENRALQYLVLPVLRAQSDPHPSQYDRRGVHAAIRKVAQLLAQGHTSAAEIDIANYYPSFDGEKVIDHLPIPKGVTRAVLLSDALNLSLAYPTSVGPADAGGDTRLFADARRGFPQGSATSALAVEMLLARLFDKLPSGGATFGYVDNFLVMAKDESDAVSKAIALWSALKAHPVGQLQPSRLRIFPPGGPIEFLGHRLRLCGGVVRIAPTQGNKKEFEGKVRNGLVKIGNFASNTDRAQRHIWELRQFVRSWTVSFKLCDGMDDYRDKTLKRIDEAVPVAWKCS